MLQIVSSQSMCPSPWRGLYSRWRPDNQSPNHALQRLGARAARPARWAGPIAQGILAGLAQVPTSLVLHLGHVDRVFHG
jgi:hypothetical protein